MWRGDHGLVRDVQNREQARDAVRGGGGVWGAEPLLVSVTWGPVRGAGGWGGGGGGGGGSRVSGAPGPLVIIGNVGWGRAKACTRFFLCTLSTTTDSGGLRY